MRVSGPCACEDDAEVRAHMSFARVKRHLVLYHQNASDTWHSQPRGSDCQLEILMAYRGRPFLLFYTKYRQNRLGFLIQITNEWDWYIKPIKRVSRDLAPSTADPFVPIIHPGQP